MATSTKVGQPSSTVVVESLDTNSLQSSKAQVVKDFLAARADEVTAVPIAACCALHEVVLRTTAATATELQKELNKAAEQLKQAVADITVVTGTDLYLRLASTVQRRRESKDFNESLKCLRQQGKHFKKATKRSRMNIARHGNQFIQEDSVVLVHGYSRAVMSLLLNASKEKHFEVVVLEGRPGNDGYRCCTELTKAGVPVTLTPDSAIGYIMEKVDLVLVGAHGVVESGGIINKLGTSTAAIVAATLNKPFYVAVETHKFVRIFPINQSDMQVMTTEPRTPAEAAAVGAVDSDSPNDKLLPEGTKFERPRWDYTSPDYITLLITDIGIFSPSAVSDELIKLYQ